MRNQKKTLYRWMWYLAVLFVFVSKSAAESAPPSIPARIGGTLIVDDAQLIQDNDTGYTIEVTRQDGSPSMPTARDTDGLNAHHSYVIDIPIYDIDDQPDGASPGDTAVIHVYKDDEELTVTSPLNGQFIVAHSGSNTTINIKLVSPISDNTAPFIENYPIIGYNNNTIDVTYSENDMQNATDEANYSFSPSLNFATSGKDITNPGGNTYRLAMSSVPSYTIFTLTVNNVTDAAGNPVTPSFIKINDNDNDDMADDWESNTDVNNPDDDPDNDGLSNVQEFNGGSTLCTDPNDADTDDDDLQDGWEVSHGLDPLDATGANGRQGDFDNDGWSNFDESVNGTNPSDDTSFPSLSPPEVKEVIPHNNAGISDNTRVPHDTSFCVRIEDSDGIDITDPDSIRFTIDDGVNVDEINIDDTQEAHVRVTKLNPGEDNTAVTRLWATYHRADDDARGNAYPYDTQINISVDVMDNTGLSKIQQSFSFKIETEAQHSDAEANSPETVPVEDDDPVLNDLEYDAGIHVPRGALKGAKIFYVSDEAVRPRLGPVDELPAFDIANADVVGLPMNLQPSTVFTIPVKLFVPCPGYTDLSSLNVYLYTGMNWVLACDSVGSLQPGGEGWMVPGSRVNHNNGAPSAIEIQVYHFSGVQAGSGETNTATTAIPVTAVSSPAGDTVGGGCFIDTTVAPCSPALIKAIGIILLMVSGLIGVARFRRAFKER